ncbi:acyltransferase domain-containing protein [Saccharopolyspora spinosa]|uniref:acyltransferase domain-containing protein n=1 Tax=Saccharopolyspora spinosa TaxID=60894 RepID=UPI003747A338
MSTVVPWVLSGRSPRAVCEQAGRLVSFVDGHDLLDVGFSLATTRAVFEHRAVVVGDRRALAAGLEALAGGGDGPELVVGAAGMAGKVVFVFPGQGSQWVGMAGGLLGSSRVFADSMAECAAVLSEFTDWWLFDVLDDEVALARVDVLQPVLWAVMVSLAALWRSFGVVPDAVVGHSQGEIAAACVAGALSLRDGARVVALRSRALRALAGVVAWWRCRCRWLRSPGMRGGMGCRWRRSTVRRRWWSPVRCGVGGVGRGVGGGGGAGASGAGGLWVAFRSGRLDS